VKLSIPPPLALYVHLPWCVRKCPYCDFNSHAVGHGAFPEGAYVEALIRDLCFTAPGSVGRPIRSIFFGGGTPSLFSGTSLGVLMEAISDNLNLADDIEITLEANPGTVEAHHFVDYRRHGVNRLSIGIQSLDDRSLQRIGRIHSAAEAVAAVYTARVAGFENINVDLMYGLPGQDADMALADLSRAAALPVTHVSWYQLTLEPNTVFYHAPPPLPDEDSIRAMEQRGHALLEGAGFARYEVSAFARPQRRSRHNVNYWEFGDYLAIGAGAHDKVTDVAGNAISRSIRHRLPARFMELAGGAGAIVQARDLNPGDLVLEFMLNALRLTGGFSPALFTERTGLPFAAIAAPIDQCVREGWLEAGAGRVTPTATGTLFLNEVLERFLPEDHAAVAERLPAG
jgi:oxygen-independent coproporphyrinogen-3 oxidase